MKKYSRSKLLQTFAYIMLLLVMLTSVGAITVKIVLKSSAHVEKTRELEKARIALSYVNMMVRQNVGQNNIRPFEENGFIIENFASVDDLNCAIYYKDGTLYEVTYHGEFSEDYAEKIVDVEGMKIELLEKGIKVKLSIEDDEFERFVAFRSFGDREGDRQ